MKAPVVSSLKQKQSRRKFDRNFKRQAVDHWVNSGKTAETVGQELGISAEQLYTWKSLLTPANGIAATVGDWEAQVAALRQENAQLREQRDI